MSYTQSLADIRNGFAPKTTGAKPKKPLKKVSDKKKKEMAEEKKLRGDEDTDLVKWYKRQIKFMDLCEESGLRLETHIYKYAIMSVCHILPKSTCPSVAIHPLNRVFLVPDLHFKFDSSSWEEREKWACWPVVRDRLVMIYPDIAPEERRHFPESVINFMENNKPF